MGCLRIVGFSSCQLKFLYAKKKKDTQARGSNLPQPTKARKLDKLKNFGGLNILTQPTILSRFGGSTRQVEPILSSLVFKNILLEFFSFFGF